MSSLTEKTALGLRLWAPLGASNTLRECLSSHCHGTPHHCTILSAMVDLVCAEVDVTRQEDEVVVCIAEALAEQLHRPHPCACRVEERAFSTCRGLMA